MPGVSCSERCHASTPAIGWSPMLCGYVSNLLPLMGSPKQRGCLPGRSLLSNVLDIDVDMRLASAGFDAPGAVFFDFAAAFRPLPMNLWLPCWSMWGFLQRSANW